ncbi:hypothetical protein SERLADRAFT_441206 [Serpula lacrymans var. lacrymans S7.9]|uniref:Uncharacterized protein n=1 Tax=Serpula lacrymans var. lacrymans (strain S7.9) TaxID=578457 RepID=F8P5U6_SERL9|nr:uncharacterized protein SERLADRAFT_441206 [Serpula lacrymans var. lacrymans S7.9]EGO21983.1 hypothetical protein SERLADRAFT_441206 [Serpula lacrymans var. lacrymans S7.9]
MGSLYSSCDSPPNLITLYKHKEHDQVPLNNYFEGLVHPTYENTQRDYIPSLVKLYRICPLTFPDLPTCLLPFDFEHTLPCGIILRKKPYGEPTYNIPSSFFTNNYYDIYSASPVHYQPIEYFCIGNNLNNLSIINYLTRLCRTLYLPQIKDLEAFGPRFGLQHSTAVVIVTPTTKDQIQRVVAGLARFDQLITIAQRKARDREDYIAEIDHIQYISKYVLKYHWVLEILTPFVVNQQSDHPEHFIVTVIQSNFWAIVSHSPQTRIYLQYSIGYQGRNSDTPLLPTVQQLFLPIAERIEIQTGSSLESIIGVKSDKGSDSEESVEGIEYWRPEEAEGGQFPSNFEFDPDFN